VLSQAREGTSKKGERALERSEFGGGGKGGQEPNRREDALQASRRMTSIGKKAGK